jgi:hypothetical protein
LLYAQAGALLEASQGIALGCIEQYSQPERTCLASFVSNTDSTPKTAACGTPAPAHRHTSTCWLLYDSADVAKCSDNTLDSILRSYGSSLLGFADLLIPVGSEDLGLSSTSSDALGLTLDDTDEDSTHMRSLAVDKEQVVNEERAAEVLRQHMFDACVIDPPTLCAFWLSRAHAYFLLCHAVSAFAGMQLHRRRALLCGMDGQVASLALMSDLCSYASVCTEPCFEHQPSRCFTSPKPDERMHPWNLEPAAVASLCRESSAAQILQSYYTYVRGVRMKGDTSSAMLCTLIRLCLASARLQLRTSATSADAILAVRLVEESLKTRSDHDSPLLMGLHMMEMVNKTETGEMTFDKYVAILDENFNVAHAAEE